mgnify:CR=1 FL=1
MGDAVNHVGGVAQPGGPAGLEASSLVDGDVDEHRSAPHPPDHVLGHQLGSGRPGDQDGSDHEVGVEMARQGQLHEHAVDIVVPVQPAVQVRQVDVAGREPGRHLEGGQVLGLGLVVRIKEEYCSIEEDEIQEIDRR